MAKQGTDVIFLNLEMSREQLFARSLSRICYRQGHKGISATDVLRGYAWDDMRREFIQEAADEYRRLIAPQMQYNPDGYNTNIDVILKTLDDAGQAAKVAGKPAPVCVLDYLHLITTDKREEQAEVLKKAVAGLKDYAIRYDTVVFAISANNRVANEKGVVDIKLKLTDIKFVQNKFEGVAKGLESMNYMVSNLVKLKIAGVDMAEI